MLESWQRAQVDAAPSAFIRGCIRSDGCAFVNRTGPYEYLSYAFHNRSEDIIGLFAWALCLVGVRDYRRTPGAVRINRRGSVAQMRHHVGLKS